MDPKKSLILEMKQLVDQRITVLVEWGIGKIGVKNYKLDKGYKKKIRDPVKKWSPMESVEPK